MSVDCVLWDNDGILVDTEPWFFEATRLAILEYGVELTRERWQSYQASGQGLVRIIEEAGTGLDVGEIRRERDDLYAKLLHENDIGIPGAIEALERIGASHRMALVTTSLRRFIDQQHAGRTLLDHFECVVTAEDCARHKPHPEPYLCAVERLGTSPERCVAVEDSPRGLASAVAAGVRCFVIRSSFMAQYPFDDAQAVLSSIAELPDAIHALH